MKIAADLVLRGGAVFCRKGKYIDCGFVAVKGNKILATGELSDAAQYIDAGTQVVEAEKNQLILPGLHDNHVHLILAGMNEKYVRLNRLYSCQETAEKVKMFADAIPEEAWIIGFGYNPHIWKDHVVHPRKALDDLLPNRPVFLLDSELHSAWANSKALAISGIDRDTKDPAFGEIVRDEMGDPTGFLHELALALVARHAFKLTETLRKDLIQRYMAKANQWGITSVSDMAPYLGLDLSFADTFCQMARQGELTLRVNGARDLFEPIETFLAIKSRYETGDPAFYRISYMKQFLDGVISNYTALLLLPYCGTESLGGALLPVEKLQAAVNDAHKNGVPVRLHACGDGAVHMALDAYEKAIREYGDTGCRHMIEHVEAIHPDDINRCGALGVIGSVQPEHLSAGIETFSDNTYPDLLGSRRERYTWPFRSLLDAGVTLAFGSDMPVVEGDPFLGIYSALTRLHADGTPAGGWNPQEKLAMEDILSAYTYGAALAEGRDGELGTLEAGKLADIVLLDRNLFSVDPAEILKTEVLCTVLDGTIVFENNT